MTQVSESVLIPWWRTALGSAESEAAAQAILEERLSDGPVTREFESCLSDSLGVPYTIATPSGSASLLLALMAAKVGPGDEVIVPAATWIATAQAAHVLGAKVVLADTLASRPVIDPDEVAELINSKTKAIMVVHLGGRAAPVDQIMEMVSGKGITVIEDACQALFSRCQTGYLGTRGHIGCYSLGVAKLLNTGQGGVVVTNDAALYDKMRIMKTNGVTADDVWETYHGPGFNFKYSDMKAAIGLVQLSRAEEKIAHVTEIYQTYRSQLEGSNVVAVCKIDLRSGEMPLWTEVETDNAQAVKQRLSENGVETKRFHVPLNLAPHFGQGKRTFPNTARHAKSILILPSGPSQPLTNVLRTCELISTF